MERQTCSIKGCSANKAYAVFKGDKVLRISFSRSLCDHISKVVPDTQVAPIDIVVGDKLEPNQKSVNGLYAICKAKTGWPLRVTMFSELAESWRDDSREVFECFVK